MYATLSFKSGWTVANAVSDIVKVLTGETNKANLSTDIIQSGTSIVSTVLAGWSVYDAAAGANKQILRAPISDDGTKFKYISIESTVANTVIFESYKSWNAGTHTGVKYNRYWGNPSTPLASGSTSTSNTILTGNPSIAFLSSSANHIAATYQVNGTTLGGLAFLTEHTRNNPWDTVANGYPPIVQTGYNINQTNLVSSLDAARWLNKNEGVDNSGASYDLSTVTRATCSAQMLVTGTSYATINQNATWETFYLVTGSVYGADKQPTAYIASIGCGVSAYGGPEFDFGGNISSKAGIYQIYKQGTMNDILIQNGTNYRIWPITTGNAYFAVIER